MAFSTIAFVGIHYASLCFKSLPIVFFLIFCQFNEPVAQDIIIQIMFGQARLNVVITLMAFRKNAPMSLHSQSKLQ